MHWTRGAGATKKQMAIFDRWITTLKPTAGDVIAESLANSAAILAWSETHRDWQRPGYMLYGNSPFSEGQDNAKLGALVATHMLGYAERIYELRQ